MNPESPYGVDFALLEALTKTVPGTGEDTKPDFLFGVGQPDGTGSQWGAEGSSLLFALDMGPSSMNIYWVDGLEDYSFPFDEVVENSERYYPDGLAGPARMDLLYEDYQHVGVTPKLVQFQEMNFSFIDTEFVAADGNSGVSIYNRIVWFQYQSDPARWCVALRHDSAFWFNITEEMIAENPELAEAPGTMTFYHSTLAPFFYTTTDYGAMAHAMMIADVNPPDPPPSGSVGSSEASLHRYSLVAPQAPAPSVPAPSTSGAKSLAICTRELTTALGEANRLYNSKVADCQKDYYIWSVGTIGGAGGCCGLALVVCAGFTPIGQVICCAVGAGICGVKIHELNAGAFDACVRAAAFARDAAVLRAIGDFQVCCMQSPEGCPLACPEP